MPEDGSANTLPPSKAQEDKGEYRVGTLLLLV